MRGRGPMGAITSSPTMVGAVTTLIVIVAVFLAYNANNGLPFVPVYRVSVEVPDAARLGGNNEVRIGGNRVGVVETIEAIPAKDATATAAADGPDTALESSGKAVARLDLKLDKDAEPLPKDSIFRVRYRSSFGLKYLEIVRGTGEGAPEGYTFNGLDDGAICSLPVDPDKFSQSIPASAKNGCFQSQTEFDEISNTFDTKTRTAARSNLVNYGNAFAARGTSLNDAVNSLEPLFRGLNPVTKTLLEPDTRFSRFFPALGRAAEIVAPVAEQNADAFTKAGITFAAISSDPQALQETISETSPTLETGIDTLPRQRPFLRDFAILAHDLRPGVTDLRATLPVLNDALEVGTPVLRDSPPTNKRLEDVFSEVNQLVSQPSTRIALQRLRDTFDSAKSLSKYVVPNQTVCNYWNYWFTFLPGALSDRDQVGYSFRQSLAGFPPQARGAERRLLGPSVQRPDQGGARRHLRALLDPDRQRPPLRSRRPEGRRLPGRPVRLRARLAAGPRSGGEQPGAGQLGPAGQPRADHPLLQRRQPAPARRYAQPVAPAADLEAGGQVRRSQGRRMPSWAIGLILVVVLAIACLPGVRQAAPVAQRLRGQGRVRLCPEPARRLAGANRGRERRQGDQDRAADRRPTARRSRRRRVAERRPRPVTRRPASRRRS